MTRKKDIIELHKKQLKLEIDAIRLAISHNAAKGSEAEYAFKGLLRKYLPQKYKLSSGFVANANNISNQHDIIIYDDFMNVPMYLGDNSGSFLGGATYGVLEATISQLGTKKLEDDIKKMATLRRLFPEGKVAFQKVVSCPIFNEDELKHVVGQCLSSGFSIDDVWSEIKEKCISEDGTFTGDPYSLKSAEEHDKRVISDMIVRLSMYVKKYVVKEKIIYSTPPPRTCLCALDGTAYVSIDSLSKTVKKLTKKYGAHIHGLLVLNKKGDDWLLSTKAYTDYEVETQEKDALFHFLENMKRDFQGMLVGKYPAVDLGSANLTG